MHIGLKGIFKPLAVLGAVVLCLSLALAAAPVAVAAQEAQTLQVFQWSVPATLSDVSGRETVLYDGATYHMWYSADEATLYHTSSATPTGFTAGATCNFETASAPAEVGSVTVLEEGGTLYMIAYEKSGTENATKKFAIYTSPATDGTAWTYAGTVFDGVAAFTTLADGINKIDGPYLFKDDLTYRLYFQVKTPADTPTRYDIYTAEATGTTLAAIAGTGDDVDFTLANDNQAVLSPKNPGAWDSVMVMHPWVVKDGGTYYMWYSAHNSPAGSPQQIGVASSADGYTWIKSRGNPILPRDTTYNALGEPSVINDGGVWRMWYLATGSAINYLTATGPFEFSSIQSAVNVASAGYTVNVAAGEYTEQVVIDKNLTLEGAGASSTIIKAPESPISFKFTENSSLWEPVVFAFGGTIGTNGGGDINIFGTGTITVTISGFTIDGNDRVPTGRSAGILLRNADGIISNNTVKNMYIDGKRTFGIAAYGDSDVVISGNNVSGYAKVGIVANGDNSTNPNPNAIITGNTVTGPGMDASVTLAPNGIQIGRGATGKIIGNTVSGNGWHDDDWSCSGILVAMSDDVEVTGNTVEENEIGIGSYGEINGTWIHDNIVNGNAYGISIQAGAVDTKVNFNNIVDNQSYGVYNGSTDTLDATNNWWGDASGPYHATLNSDGKGNKVSDSVDFEPWIGAAVDTEETVVKTVPAGGGAVIPVNESPTGGAITVTGGTAGATLVAAQYASNPGGAHGLQAQGYYDVHLSNATGVSSVTIQFAGLPNTVIYYWDGTAWTACSDQEYAGGVVTVTIRSSGTTPGLSYLTGGPFMPATSPPIGGEAFPISPWAANAPLIALCVALAAGAGVFVWRRARA